MDVIDVATDIDEQLVQWIIHATAGNADQVNQMKKVIALRGELDQAINVIVLKRLQVSAIDVSADVKQLTAIDEGLAGAAKNIDTATTIISFAATAVSTASKIVSLVA